MNEKNNWIDQVKKVPDWIKGAIALLITVAGFIIAFRSDRYLYATLLGFSIFISLLCTLTYIAYARSPSPFGGRGAFKFERYRRLALVGDLGLVIIAIVILNSGVGRTYLAYTIQGTPTATPTASPETVPMTALGAAPENKATLEPGIYISRLIEEADPDYKGAIKLSVWLSANGDYYVDSVRIVHLPSGAESGGSDSAAIYPDANYGFTYTNGSDETYALNPALQLSSTDNREVYFTLALVPKGHFGGTLGHVYARINYHSPGGKVGSLLLVEPPSDIVVLSQLISTNVMIQWRRGQPLVITPNGLQRGHEEQVTASDTVIEYSRLDFDNFVLPYVKNAKDLYGSKLRAAFFALGSLPGEPPKINLGTRSKINESLLEQDKFLEIVDRVSPDDLTYIDLCAGLATIECKQALIKIAPRSDYFYKIVEALIISHMIQPDETLANFALANISRFESHTYGYEDQIIFGLTAHPVGSWFDVLVGLAPYQDNACKALNLRKSMIDEDKYKLVKDACDR